MKSKTLSCVQLWQNFHKKPQSNKANTEQENTNSNTQNVFNLHQMCYCSRKQLELVIVHSSKQFFSFFNLLYDSENSKIIIILN